MALPFPSRPGPEGGQPWGAKGSLRGAKGSLRGPVLALLLGLALAWGGPAAAADATLLEAARHLAGQSQGFLAAQRERLPRPTWGQSQALGDLERLQQAAASLAAALQEPGATPAGLGGQLDALESALFGLRVSLPLLALEGDEAGQAAALVGQARALQASVRALRHRFLGRAQPVGPELAATTLSQSLQPPVYASPDELFAAARGLRQDAERLAYAWRCTPGAVGSISPFDAEAIAHLAWAARQFEYATAGSYGDVRETLAAFLTLRRAYRGAQGALFRRAGSSAAWDLQRTMQRLEGFYAELVP